jgi:hypothetical protein
MGRAHSLSRVAGGREKAIGHSLIVGLDEQADWGPWRSWCGHGRTG